MRPAYETPSVTLLLLASEDILIESPIQSADPEEQDPSIELPRLNM